MSPDGHYARAEELLALAHDAGNIDDARVFVAVAQVHATLAAPRRPGPVRVVPADTPVSWDET